MANKKIGQNLAPVKTRAKWHEVAAVVLVLAAVVAIFALLVVKPG